MADKEVTAASVNEAKQDPSKVADEVVNNLKSQGLFDQFRKECLEELEHLVTLNPLSVTSKLMTSINVQLEKHIYKPLVTAISTIHLSR